MKTTLLTGLAGALLALVSFTSTVGCAAEASSPDDEIAAESQEADLKAVDPLGAEPQGNATQYPLVLCHGFLGSDDALASFHTLITDGLTNDGHSVHRAEVPPLGSVHMRAVVLAKYIDGVLAKTGAKKVNLVAHSMGGLDAREVVSTLGYGDRVASVTTISTPHRGSGVADVSLKLFPKTTNDDADKALRAIAKAIGKTYNDVADDADIKAALVDLSEANAPAFNASHPDDARVYYQSWAGVSSILAIPNQDADARACDGKLTMHDRRADLMSPVLAPGAGFVTHGKVTPTDGLVLVSSAKWGNFRGCVPADHADEIGVFHTKALDPHTGFDFVRFHRNIAFDLAARGF